MGKKVLIVESPGKIKKLSEILGGGYKVMASVGHVRDLPKEYGIDLATMDETYVLNPDKKKVISALKEAVKSADHIILATDLDREGEAIAWHLQQELKISDASYSRVTFSDITEEEVQKGITNPRKINFRLVNAQRSRRVLDRFVGYDVSKEICWPAGARSAGRVQTPALHMICELERKIINFVPKDYFVLKTQYEEGFTSFVPEVRAPTNESSEDLTEKEGEEKASGRLMAKQFATKEEAEKVLLSCKNLPHIVSEIKKSLTYSKPGAPYTTSSLQQDGSRKLTLSVAKVMELAQTLYESGFITYHRTDSPSLSEEAIKMARDYISKIAPAALPAKPPAYRSKSGAQEAHEAIRPAGKSIRTAEELQLTGSEADLYKMIVARFLASQCKPAVFNKTEVWIKAGTVPWVQEGSMMAEAGFLVFWGPYHKREDTELPPLSESQTLVVKNSLVEAKKTPPPSRMIEGDFTQQLENSGVGRPATFASIIKSLKASKYIEEVKIGKSKNAVIKPTELGLKLDELLSQTFPEIVTPEYTANMEKSLDDIVDGALTRTDFLFSTYSQFRALMDTAKPKAKEFCEKNNLGSKKSNALVSETEINCELCGKAKHKKIEMDNGAFYACSSESCKFTRDINALVTVGGCKAEGCGGTLVERRRKDNSGSFLACIKPQCKYIENKEGENGSPRANGEETEILCDSCQSSNYRKIKTKNGAFLACSSEACTFTRDVKAKIKKNGCKTEGCKGNLVERKRKDNSGSFFACARQGCKYIENSDGKGSSGGKYEREETDKKCPRCEKGNLVLFKMRENPEGTKGADFYACTTPKEKCGFTLPFGSRKHKVPCPKCGGTVLERFAKDGRRFWACAKANCGHIQGDEVSPT